MVKCCGKGLIVTTLAQSLGSFVFVTRAFAVVHSRVHHGNWKRDGRGERVGCNMRMVNDKSLSAIVRFVLGQLELLAASDQQLRAISEAAQTVETPKTGLEDIVQTIRVGLEGSEEVYREVVERITVFEDYIDVQVKFVPGLFRICYDASGKRETYTTTIRRWKMVQPDQPGMDGVPPAS